MEIVSLPSHVPNGKFILGIANYTVPADTRLRVTHAWAAAGGTVTTTILERDVLGAGTRTILGAAGSLSGLDVWVPATGVLTITGTAGFAGWIEPAFTAP